MTAMTHLTVLATLMPNVDTGYNLDPIAYQTYNFGCSRVDKTFLKWFDNGLYAYFF